MYITTCHLLQSPPLLVSSIKVNPGVCSQHLQLFPLSLPHCLHHWRTFFLTGERTSVVVAFRVESVSSQGGVAEQQLQHLSVSAHRCIDCTRTIIVHNVHIYVWN